MKSLNFDNIPEGEGYFFTDMPIYDFECTVKMKFFENMITIIFYFSSSVYVLNLLKRKFNERAAY